MSGGGGARDWDKELATRFEAWQREWTAALKELKSLASEGDEKKTSEAQQRLQKIYKGRADFMREEMTGFVWMYLQK